MTVDIRAAAPARQVSRFTPEFDVASLATSEQCLEAMDTLDAEKSAIEAQLELSAARFRTSGERGDPFWFSKAKSALRLKCRLRQRVQERLGVLRRAERGAVRVAEAERFERRFVDAARALLPPATFEELVRAAAPKGGQPNG